MEGSSNKTRLKEFLQTVLSKYQIYLYLFSYLNTYVTCQFFLMVTVFKRKSQVKLKGNHY